MDKLITIINELRDAFNLIGHKEIDLPQIVAIGSQSSGKSSVIENIVGKDFLPRGVGIVTRCPLILQLNKTEESDEDKEWGEFLHIPGKKFTSFKDVKREIENQTNMIAGNRKNISTKPINLKIYSKMHFNLTIVDMPGIIKIPTDGQSLDIEHQIYDLVREYINNPNSIILAITPANIDIVNSESLKLANEVDPEGNRTIGVLTKLDLMDRGTNAYGILANQSFYKLKFGFIGLVCRSQESIDNNKGIEVSLYEESRYFEKHELYAEIKERCGTFHLVKTLNQILMDQIKKTLPNIIKRINCLMDDAKKKLVGFGSCEGFYPENSGIVLLKLITRFSNHFMGFLNGSFNEQILSINELFGGSKVNSIFENNFLKTLDLIENEINSQHMLNIESIIKNSMGIRPKLFLSQNSFEIIVRNQIEKLKEPGINCLELVYEELVTVLKSCQNIKDLQRFPYLIKRLLEISVGMVQDQMIPTKKMIENLIDIEMSYINTSHPDFPKINNLRNLITKIQDSRHNLDEIELTKENKIKTHKNSSNSGILDYLFKHGYNGSNKILDFHDINTVIKDAIPNEEAFRKPLKPYSNFCKKEESVFDTKKNGPGDNITNALQFGEDSDLEIQIISSLVKSYFRIVKKNVSDLIPKTIVHFLVNFLRDNLHNRLVSELYDEKNFISLLQEDESIVKERKSLLDTLCVLKKVSSIVKSISDL